MKKIYILIFLLIALHSCVKHEVNSTKDAIIDFSIDAIKSGKINKLQALVLKDTTKTNIFKSKNEMNYLFLKHPFDESTPINFLKHQEKVYHKKHYNIFGNVIGKDSIETDEHNYYFKVDTSYFELRTILKKVKNNYFFEEVHLYDMSSECKNSIEINDLIKEANIKSSLKFKGIVWKSSLDRKTFKEFYLRGVNDTKHHILTIKFKLRLIDQVGNEFFIKTVDYFLNTKPGDTFEIPITDLENYYAGFVITKKSLRFLTSLIDFEIEDDIRDENNNDFCLKIDELKSTS